MAEQLDQLGFSFLERAHGVVTRDLYHTGIEFTSWDLKAGLLRFTIHGSSEKQSGKGVERPLAYKLHDHTIVSP
jgi:hypothetical protein